MVQDIFFACVLIALLAVFHRQIREVLEDLNNRRGGPPTPRHPSPSLDDEILRRRIRL
jgi:hypothetical protein